MGPQTWPGMDPTYSIIKYYLLIFQLLQSAEIFFVLHIWNFISVFFFFETFLRFLDDVFDSSIIVDGNKILIFGIELVAFSC